MRVISYGAACGSAAAASADFPSTPGSGPGSDVAHVARAFSLGFAFTTPMLFTVCRQLRLSCFSECSTGFFEAALSRGYCASYDGPDEDLLSCSSDSDFTHEAGTLGMLASCHIDTWPEPLRNCARLAPSKRVGLSARRAMLASRTAEALALAAPVLRIGILLQPSVIDGRDHFSPV